MSSRIMMTATGTGGTESSLAAIDVPNDGFIQTVAWHCIADLDTDADTVIWQLSFGSTFAAANDSRQVVSMCHLSSSIITAAGAVPVSINYYDNLGNGIPVSAGERLFVNVQATASVTSTGRCMITFSFDESRPSVRRR